MDVMSLRRRMMMADEETGNLFDNTAIVYKRWINSSNFWYYSDDSSSYFAPVKPGHTYLISGYPLDMTVYRIGILDQQLPTEASTDSYKLKQVVRESSAEDFGVTHTITAGDGARYLIMQFNRNRMQDILDNLSVVKV